VRARCPVSRLSTRATSGPEEPLVLAAPRRAAVIAAALTALTAVAFAVMANRGALSHIQRLDDSWLRLMISVRDPTVTVIAKAFNVLGLVYVMLPARVAIAGYLAFRRRWWHLAAFAAAVVLSEVLIGPVKAASRAYLAAHWLSDAVAGLLLGTSCALLAAVTVDWAQRGWRRRHGIRDVPPRQAVRPGDRR
jgi:hypothetical protein